MLDHVGRKDKLKGYFSQAFKMKDMGRANHCVGLCIMYDENNISLDQEEYTTEILKRFNLIDCKPIATTSDPNQKLYMDMCPKTAEEQELQRSAI